MLRNYTGSSYHSFSAAVFDIFYNKPVAKRVVWQTYRAVVSTGLAKLPKRHGPMHSGIDVYSPKDVARMARTVDVEESPRSSALAGC